MIPCPRKRGKMAAMQEDATPATTVFSMTVMTVIENSRTTKCKLRNKLIRVNRASTFKQILQQFWPGDGSDGLEDGEFDNVSDVQLSCSARAGSKNAPYQRHGYCKCTQIFTHRRLNVNTARKK